MSFYYNKTLSGCFRQLKNKGIFQLGNPKSGRGRLRESNGRLREVLIHYKVQVTVQTGFHKGGRNQPSP